MPKIFLWPHYSGAPVHWTAWTPGSYATGVEQHSYRGGCWVRVGGLLSPALAGHRPQTKTTPATAHSIDYVNERVAADNCIPTPTHVAQLYPPTHGLLAGTTSCCYVQGRWQLLQLLYQTSWAVAPGLGRVCRVILSGFAHDSTICMYSVLLHYSTVQYE